MNTIGLTLEQAKIKKLVVKILRWFFAISIVIIFSVIILNEFTDRPTAYVPNGTKKVVAVQVVKKDKSGYEILVPGDPGFAKAKKAAIEIPVSPDYVPTKEK